MGLSLMVPLSLRALLPFFWLFMSCLFWNFRGANGRSFPGLVRDYIRIYNLDFIAILEPRISGSKADEVIRKIGIDG